MTPFLDRQPKTAAFCVKSGFLRNNLKKPDHCHAHNLYLPTIH